MVGICVRGVNAGQAAGRKLAATFSPGKTIAALLAACLLMGVQPGLAAADGEESYRYMALGERDDLHYRVDLDNTVCSDGLFTTWLQIRPVPQPFARKAHWVLAGQQRGAADTIVCRVSFRQPVGSEEDVAVGNVKIFDSSGRQVVDWYPGDPADSTVFPVARIAAECRRIVSEKLIFQSTQSGWVAKNMGIGKISWGASIPSVTKIMTLADGSPGYEADVDVSCFLGDVAPLKKTIIRIGMGRGVVGAEITFAGDRCQEVVDFMTAAYGRAQATGDGLIWRLGEEAMACLRRAGQKGLLAVRENDERR
jgi:hypothetical protein